MAEDIQCKTKGCARESDADHGGITFLATNIFGHRAKQSLAGYCGPCAKNRLWVTWLGLVGIICAMIAAQGLPDWKPAGLSALIFAIWLGVYRRLKP